MGKEKSVTIDWGRVDKLLKAQCNLVEIAADLGVNEKTVKAHCINDHNLTWGDYKKSKKAVGTAEAKLKHYKKVTQDEEWPAQKSFLQNYCGLSDKQVVENVGNNAPQVVVYLPENGRGANG